MPRRRLTPFRIAMREVLRHRLRTILVAQGMVWGIALSIAPAAVIEGSKKQALERAREMGTDVITVSASGGSTVGRKAAPRESDLETLRASLDPENELTAFRWARASLAEMPGGVWLYGVDDAVASLQNLRVLAGEIAELDRDRSAREEVPVMVEWTLARRLLGDISDDRLDPSEQIAVAERLVGSALVFTQLPPERGAEAPVPLRLHLSGTETAGSPPTGPADRVLRVVAVVSDPSQRKLDALGNERGRATTEILQELIQLAGVSADPAPWLQEGLGIYLPRRLVAGATLDWIMIRAHPLEMTSLSDRIERALVDRGRVPLIRTNAVLPVLSNPEIHGYMRIHAVLYWVFLIIGGCVLMNIMLLSGQQRRREIALRRAEGARRLDVFFQFLWEGMATAVVGLVLGTAAGLFLALVRVWIDGNIAFSVTVPWGEVLRSWAGLFGLALIASSIPAWEATTHDPIQLLRRDG